MNKMVKVAGVQMDVTFADKGANLERIHQYLETTAKEGAQLTVFPECSLTGYCYYTLDEAREQAEEQSGPSLSKVTEHCQQLGIHTVVGYLERQDDLVFNACALIGPTGVVGNYRKVHLPYLGVDMYTTTGDQDFAVHSTGDLQLGMNICYDAAFPEASRVLALEGADLIVLPTNWPPGAECTSECIVNARALENHVYYLAVNRVGTERGFEFIGNSRLCDPSGRVLTQAHHKEEAVIYGEIDLDLARKKRVIRVPGKHEIDRFADRHPEKYSKITQPIPNLDPPKST